MPAAVGAVRLALCAWVPFTARLGVLLDARLLIGAALFGSWLMRTTVVDVFAVPVPRFAIVQVALTAPPALTEVGLTAPFSSCRSVDPTGAVPVTAPFPSTSPFRFAALWPAVFPLSTS